MNQWLSVKPPPLDPLCPDPSVSPGSSPRLRSAPRRPPLISPELVWRLGPPSSACSWTPHGCLHLWVSWHLGPAEKEKISHERESETDPASDRTTLTTQGTSIIVTADIITLLMQLRRFIHYY